MCHVLINEKKTQKKTLKTVNRRHSFLKEIRFDLTTIRNLEEEKKKKTKQKQKQINRKVFFFVVKSKIKRVKFDVNGNGNQQLER